jgi:hypothetical protein
MPNVAVKDVLPVNLASARLALPAGDAGIAPLESTYASSACSHFNFLIIGLSFPSTIVGRKLKVRAALR